MVNFAENFLMQKFKSRLKYYLIGFGMGLVFMFFIFGNRACSWLPENRVKNMIAEKEIIVGDSLADLMACQGVDNEDVYRFLNADGDVDFSRSQTENEPKEYLFTGKKGNEDLEIRFALFDDQAEVIAFDFPQKNCETNLSNDHKQIVPLPNFEVIAIIESKEMRILTTAECQLKCLKISEEKIKTFHLDATVDMEQSQPRLQPNPIYIMKGKLGGKELTVEYVIGENRTRIASVRTSEDSCGCE